MRLAAEHRTKHAAGPGYGLDDIPSNYVINQYGKMLRKVHRAFNDGRGATRSGSDAECVERVCNALKEGIDGIKGRLIYFQKPDPDADKTDPSAHLLIIFVLDEENFHKHLGTTYIYIS